MFGRRAATRASDRSSRRVLRLGGHSLLGGMCAVFLIAACSPTDTSVPSASLSTDGSVTSSITSSPPITPAQSAETLPRCVRTQLRAKITGNDGATGHTAAYLVVFNPSRKACNIIGPAQLELRDAKNAVGARSQGRAPFMAWPKSPPHLIAVDALSSAGDWDKVPRARRVGLTVLAQGACPGGVFPSGGHLRLLLPSVGAVRVEGFEGTLPLDYRCDEGRPSPSGPPELLIGDLLEPDDFE